MTLTKKKKAPKIIDDGTESLDEWAINITEKTPAKGVKPLNMSIFSGRSVESPKIKWSFYPGFDDEDFSRSFQAFMEESALLAVLNLNNTSHDLDASNQDDEFYEADDIADDIADELHTDGGYHSTPSSRSSSARSSRANSAITRLQREPPKPSFETVDSDYAELLPTPMDKGEVIIQSAANLYRVRVVRIIEIN